MCIFCSEQKQQIITQLGQVLGNKPNIIVNIDAIKVVGESKCHVVIFIQEKSATSNETKRILASEVVNVLNQPMTKNQLATMGVEDAIALVAPDEDQMKEYLDKPPKGNSAFTFFFIPLDIYLFSLCKH